MPIPKKPKLTNRGGPGLYSKLTPEVRKGMVPQNRPTEPTAPHTAKHRIAPALKKLIVPISSLTHDPLNARLHPDDNMGAIKSSLTAYGQLKPIVVRKEGMIVVAGNGTLAAARALGWEDIAASVVEMTDAEALGYGLADNKTAELAKWDFETVSRIEALLAGTGIEMTGWPAHELEVLRMADWVQPELSDENFDAVEGAGTYKVSPEEKEIIEVALGVARERLGKKKATDGECLSHICNQWLMPPTEEE